MRHGVRLVARRSRCSGFLHVALLNNLGGLSPVSGESPARGQQLPTRLPLYMCFSVRWEGGCREPVAERSL